MSRNTNVEYQGRVIEALPSAMFKVRLDNGHVLLGYLAGRIRQNKISVLVNDEVTIEVSPYDLTKGRITYRHKGKPAPAAT